MNPMLLMAMGGGTNDIFDGVFDSDDDIAEGEDE